MLWLRKARKIAKVKYDFIICGGGSAGCVLANRLSEDGSKNVLLLEAGPSDNIFAKHDSRLGKLLSWKIHMPAALQYNLQDEKYNWFYETVPQKHANNRSFYWPRGRVLGGSSSLNAMVYVRGHGKDQDRWAEEIGDEKWNYDHLLPYFKKSQNFYAAEEDDFYKGRSGPLHVGDGDFNTPLYQAFIQAGVEAGYAKTEDINGYQQEGFGKLPMTVNKYDGSRANASSCYLDPARKRENLTILSDTLVDKVVFSGTTASGVNISSFKSRNSFGENFFIEASEVILCGGAINSPQMLQLSGIGNAVELEKAEVDPIVDLPGVGENLQDHIEISVSHRTLPGLSLQKYQKSPLMQLIGAEWFLKGTGICATNHFHAGAFIRTKAAEELDHPDIQLHFVPSQYLDHGRGELTEEAFQAHVGTLRAKSTGHIKIRSNNPREHPKIDPKYLSHPEDLPDLVECLKLTREIFAQSAFDEFRKAELVPGKEFKNDKEIEEWIKSFIETVYHPACSCKMGKEEDPMAVVDSECRVFGTQGLRVIDASIMPSIASGNLNAPTIAIAEKAADIILAKDPLVLANSPYFLADTRSQR